MHFQQSGEEDIPVIFDFYAAAINYQQQKFDKQWLPFDLLLVKETIDSGRQWKIIEDDGRIAAIFSVAYEDVLIWQENNIDPAIYLHRIVTHPAFKGRNYMRSIIDWAKQHAQENGKKFIRLDTWGDNEGLVNYYIRCGFTFIQMTTPSATAGLPKHYSAIFLALLEIAL